MAYPSAAQNSTGKVQPKSIWESNQSCHGSNQLLWRHDETNSVHKQTFQLQLMGKMIHCYNMARLNGKTKTETLNWILRLETSRCEYKMPLSQGYSKYKILQNVLKWDSFCSSVRVIISPSFTILKNKSQMIREVISPPPPLLKHTLHFRAKWFVTSVWLKLSKSSL